MGQFARITSFIEKEVSTGLLKIRNLFRFKYPKLMLLVAAIITAYYIFSHGLVPDWMLKITGFGYIGLFVIGMLFSFGFSAPFSVGFLIAAQPSNIYLAALTAGLGALASDMLIFHSIKFSFQREFQKLRREKLLRKLRKLVNKSFGLRITSYILYFFAGILIASPLPDEIGITMLAGLTTIKPKILAFISLTLNTTGIGVILFLSSA